MQRLAFPSMLAGFLLAGSLAGCNRNSQDKTVTEQTIAPVAKPESRKVQDFVDYTGRTNAKVSVVVQSRVTGYLAAMPFKEGDNVRKDDVLFVIDPRPYEAQLEAAEAQKRAAESQKKSAASQKDAAESQLAVSRTKLVYARATNKRYQELAKEKPGAVSPRELDQYQALDDQAFASVVQSEANVAVAEANFSLAEANLALAEANLKQPRLNVEWTKVRSPIDGHISRYYLTLGNLVNADSSQLTTVIKLVPLVGLVVLGLPHVHAANLHMGGVPGVGALSRTSVLLFFAFMGFETALNTSGEVTAPARTVPRALLVALAMIAALYLGLQLVAQGVLGPALATAPDRATREGCRGAASARRFTSSGRRRADGAPAPGSRARRRRAAPAGGHAGRRQARRGPRGRRARESTRGPRAECETRRCRPSWATRRG